MYNRQLFLFGELLRPLFRLFHAHNYKLFLVILSDCLWGCYIILGKMNSFISVIILISASSLIQAQIPQRFKKTL